SSRSIAKAGNDEAESRVDYLADILGISKDDVITAVNIMRQEGLLEDSMDMSAYIFASDTENRSRLMLERFAKLESFLLSNYLEDGLDFNLKELNESAQSENIVAASVKNLRTLMYFHTIKNYIRKSEDGTTRSIRIFPAMDQNKLIDKFNLRIDICRFILKNLFEKVHNTPDNERGTKPVDFSLVGLFQEYKTTLDVQKARIISLVDIEDALLYLSKIGALRIEGGFLVLYNGMEIKRLISDNRVKYKVDDYRYLDEFYKQKIRQVHIVGEYANLMVKDYVTALQFVQDYFQEDFRKFISKYFKGERIKEIDRNITPEKYNQLFNTLSPIQSEIINDSESKYIVVAAGPGSGKTRVLVHKLAALLLMEDVKHEQLLMVTFSRAAATEFKKRLIELVGNAASFIEIKTFHSYCFDLLGKIGNLDAVDDVVKDAARMIESGEVEPGKITKSVLVIDEAQDMDANEFNLVKALMQVNDDMRVIAVGDDDQNIYEFRGSDSAYLKSLIDDYDATVYEMTENYRSKSAIISLSNEFLETINNRMKTLPVEAVHKEYGTVQITHHTGKHMAQAIVNHIEESKHSGKVCVLTNTNNEALQILGLLNKQNIHAKLIQSMDGFSLYNLAEIRYFLKAIDRELKTPVIPNSLWDKAKQKLFDNYADSSCIEICQNLINDFETVSSIKYRSDLDEFIKESNYEDFYNDEQNSIYVSTIHKSKGREFDVVYMLLNGTFALSDEEKRKLYVGLTRAKSELYIHCNTDLFSSYDSPGIVHFNDNRIYGEPEEISLQLTHKDVVLDFFKGKKELIFKLHSGSPLFIVDSYLCAEISGRTVKVAKLSKAFNETLENLSKQGYQPYNAVVRFIVAWRGENDEDESAVLLANISLRK
ncbi:MAG: ATP-dependent helicase, partial [Oscillospiraceae bacterium]|nr:ATP-dependent helicase [Oscillospiraceae bacterium]